MSITVDFSFFFFHLAVVFSILLFHFTSKPVEWRRDASCRCSFFCWEKRQQQWLEELSRVYTISSPSTQGTQTINQSKGHKPGAKKRERERERERERKKEGKSCLSIAITSCTFVVVGSILSADKPAWQRKEHTNKMRLAILLETLNCLSLFSVP